MIERGTLVHVAGQPFTFLSEYDGMLCLEAHDGFHTRRFYHPSEVELPAQRPSQTWRYMTEAEDRAQYGPVENLT